MRDNWMIHPEFSGGDAVFAISHTMLVDRLQYLPGNQIEGNQTVMVRAILDDDASTNLVIHLYVLGSESKDPQAAPGFIPGFIPGFPAVLVSVSLIGAALLGRRKEE